MVLLFTLLLFVALVGAFGLLHRAPHRVAPGAAAVAPPLPARTLSPEELAGVAANLFAACGFTLRQQEVVEGYAQLELTSPGQPRTQVVCVSGEDGFVDAARVMGVLGHRLTPGAHQAVLLTSDRFSDTALRAAVRQQCELVDGTRLVRLLEHHLPGVREALGLEVTPLPDTRTAPR